jgi:hypothetical protein
MRVVGICKSTEPILLAPRQRIEQRLGPGDPAEPQSHRRT